MIVTTCSFKRIPPEKTFPKSLRRRSRCSGLNRRSEGSRSGGEFAPSLRTPGAEDSATCLGRHSGSETVTPFTFQVARLKSAFHGTAPDPDVDPRKTALGAQPKEAESTGAYR